MALTLTLSNPSGPTIYATECPGSPRESMQGDIFKVSRTFLVNYDLRWQFVRVMLGDATLVATNFPATPYYITRINPQGYKILDTSAGSTWLFPTSIESIEPIGPINTISEDPSSSAYDYAKVTIGYEAIHYVIRDDYDPKVFNTTTGFPDESTLYRNVSFFQQPVAEFLTLPFGAYRWVEWVSGPQVFSNTLSTTDTGNYNAGAPVIGSQGKIIGAAEVQFMWYNVPTVPTAAKTAQGTVNKFTLTYPSLGSDNQPTNSASKLTAPPQTLLLTSVEIKPKKWFANKFLFDITYKMKYFNPTNGSLDANGKVLINHNTFLHYFQKNALIPDYRYITHNGNHPFFPGSNLLGQALSPGKTVYDQTDFSLLFQPF